MWGNFAAPHWVQVDCGGAASVQLDARRWRVLDRLVLRFGTAMEAPGSSVNLFGLLLEIERGEGRPTRVARFGVTGA